MNYFIASPRRLLLADALGAMLTVALTVGVLARWTHLFGMPAEALHQLAMAGSVFAMYSFSCCLFVRRSAAPFLRIIALANMGYCVATMVLCVVYRAQITSLGWVYFVGECLVIVALAAVEMRVAAGLNRAEENALAR
jgi:hypothetical protein